MNGAHEADLKMIFPLIVLGLGAIFYGFLTRDLIIGLGSLYFNQTYTNFYNFNMCDSEFLPAIIKNIPLIFTLITGVWTLLVNKIFEPPPRIKTFLSFNEFSVFNNSSSE